ncbi:MAG: oxygenase MpaB family protein [Actinomycetales bacterium]
MTLTSIPDDPRAGLFGPDSVTWRLHSDPLLWVAGLRALYLQALHPVALAGVTSFSSFREDPWGRLMRTGEWVGVTTFADAREARRLAARVRGLHRRVRGTHEGTGRTYRADDPDLLLWIHICLVDSVIDVVRRAGIALSESDADRYVAEQVRIAELVGLDTALVPATVAELRAAVDSYLPVLDVDAETRDVARFVLAPPMPLAVQLATPARPAWTTISAMALASLPSWARELYGLPVLPLSEPLTGLGLSVSLRALRLATLALPAPLREGPHLRAAKARLAEVNAA